MSNERYDSLVDYAYSLVNIANKNYLEGEEMYYYGLITGFGNWLVEGRPGDGHNYQAVIDAIHLYLKDYPTSRANEGFEKDFTLLCKVVDSMFAVQFVLNCIVYEIKKEREGSNSFKMDCQGLLNKLRQGIEGYHEELKSEYPDLDKFVEETSLFIKKNYGYSF